MDEKEHVLQLRAGLVAQERRIEIINNAVVLRGSRRRIDGVRGVPNLHAIAATTFEGPLEGRRAQTMHVFDRNTRPERMKCMAPFL